jgi:hypothetical protein
MRTVSPEVRRWRVIAEGERIGDEQRRIMYLVPAPAVKLVKSSYIQTRRK